MTTKEILERAVKAKQAVKNLTADIKNATIEKMALELEKSTE